MAPRDFFPPAPHYDVIVGNEYPDLLHRTSTGIDHPGVDLGQTHDANDFAIEPHDARHRVPTWGVRHRRCTAAVRRNPRGTRGART
jgi:hypothetical protein